VLQLSLRQKIFTAHAPNTRDSDVALSSPQARADWPTNAGGPGKEARYLGFIYLLQYYALVHLPPCPPIRQLRKHTIAAKRLYTPIELAIEFREDT
jgi:hypothetical protein